MYKAKAMRGNDEIGFAEGATDHEAVEACIDSIPQIYKDAYTKDIRLIVRYNTGCIAYVTSILQYALDTE
jgi:hypothetical protein